MDNEFGTDIPPIEDAQGGKNNRTLIIIIVVLLVLCCCCIGVSLLFYYVLGDPLMELINDMMGFQTLLLTV